eukprot:CFRG4343T1
MVPVTDVHDNRKRKRNELFGTYNSVQTLNDYLEKHVSHKPKAPSIIRNTDSDEFKVLVQECLIAIPYGTPEIGRVVKNFEQCSSQADVVHRLIGNLFQLPSHVRYPSDHVLTCGYRAVRNQSNHGVKSIQGVESKHINTIVTYLKTRVWEVLLSRIGDDLMTYLLQYTAIFTPLPNGCYLQVSGPVAHLEVVKQKGIKLGKRKPNSNRNHGGKQNSRMENGCLSTSVNVDAGAGILVDMGIGVDIGEDVRTGVDICTCVRSSTCPSTSSCVAASTDVCIHENEEQTVAATTPIDMGMNLGIGLLDHTSVGVCHNINVRTSDSTMVCEHGQAGLGMGMRDKSIGSGDVISAPTNCRITYSSAESVDVDFIDKALRSSANLPTPTCMSPHTLERLLRQSNIEKTCVGINVDADDLHVVGIDARKQVNRKCYCSADKHPRKRKKKHNGVWRSCTCIDTRTKFSCDTGDMNAHGMDMLIDTDANPEKKHTHSNLQRIDRRTLHHAQQNVNAQQHLHTHTDSYKVSPTHAHPNPRVVLDKHRTHVHPLQHDDNRSWSPSLTQIITQDSGTSMVLPLVGRQRRKSSWLRKKLKTKRQQMCMNLHTQNSLPSSYPTPPCFPTPPTIIPSAFVPIQPPYRPISSTDTSLTCTHKITHINGFMRCAAVGVGENILTGEHVNVEEVRTDADEFNNIYINKNNTYNLGNDMCIFDKNSNVHTTTYGKINTNNNGILVHRDYGMDTAYTNYRGIPKKIIACEDVDVSGEAVGVIDSVGDGVGVGIFVDSCLATNGVGREKKYLSGKITSRHLLTSTDILRNGNTESMDGNGPPTPVILPEPDVNNTTRQMSCFTHKHLPREWERHASYGVDTHIEFPHEYVSAHDAYGSNEECVCAEHTTEIYRNVNRTHEYNGHALTKDPDMDYVHTPILLAPPSPISPTLRLAKTHTTPNSMIRSDHYSHFQPSVGYYSIPNAPSTHGFSTQNVYSERSVHSDDVANALPHTQTPACEVLKTRNRDLTLDMNINDRCSRGAQLPHPTRTTGVGSSLTRSGSAHNRSIRNSVTFPSIGQKYSEAYALKRNQIFYSHISGFRQRTNMLNGTSRSMSGTNVIVEFIFRRKPVDTVRRLTEPQRACRKLLLLLLRQFDACSFQMALDRHCPNTLAETQPTEANKGEVHILDEELRRISEREPQGSVLAKRYYHFTKTLSGRKDIVANDDGDRRKKQTTTNKSRSLPANDDEFTCKQMLGCDTQQEQVVRFLHAVVAKVVPATFFGSKHNQRVVFDGIGMFCRLRRFETIAVHNILYGIKINDMQWMYDSDDSQKNTPIAASIRSHTSDVLGDVEAENGADVNNISTHTNNYKHSDADTHIYGQQTNQGGTTYQTTKPEEADNTIKFKHTLSHALRRRMVGQFMVFLYECLIIPLVQTYFYCTEHSNGRQRTYYYRKDVWERIHTQGLKSIQHMLTPITANEAASIMGSRTLPSSRLRFLPKADSVRLIVNMSKKEQPQGPAGWQPPSINDCLKNLFHVLTFEKERRTKENNNAHGSVSNLSNIYEKLGPYIKNWKHSKPRKPVYLVTVDVKSAFDTIKHDQLLATVENLLQEDDYHIRGYATVTSNNGKLKRQFRKKAGPGDAFVRFPEFVTNLVEDGMRDTLISDQVACDFEDKDNLVRLLRQHLRQNLLQVKDQWYQQNVGVPQGSIISSLLCSFYLEDLQRARPLLSPQTQATLLRYVDDYLLLTTDLNEAKQFVRLMHSDYGREYGMRVNPSKTIVSFHMDIDGVALKNTCESDEFPWCGLLIDTKSLDVKANFFVYAGCDLRDSWTIPFSACVGETFASKISMFCRQKCHPILFDCGHNSVFTVSLNVYQIMYMTWMKVHCFLREMKDRVNFDFIIGVLRHTIKNYYDLIRCRLNTFLKEPLFFLNRKNVTWLSAHALQRVFQIKQTKYRDILKEADYLLKANVDPTRADIFSRVTHPRNISVFSDIRY